MSDDRDLDPPRWRRYLRFWRTDVAADVRDEIAFHIEESVTAQMTAGVTEADARRIATERFGNTDQIARVMRALAIERESTVRRAEFFSSLGRDLRFARRQLAKRPGFTIVAILTLALGIGANTAIFSAVNAVLLHPLPVHDLDQLVLVRSNIPKLPLMNANLDAAEVLEMVDHPGVFQSVAGYTGSSLIFAGNNHAQRLQSHQTVGPFFDVLGVTPALGRFYRPDESTPGRHRVVVLSWDLWQELGGQPSILGKKMDFLLGTYEVIGVAPRGFHYPRSAQVWVPYPIAPAGACGDARRTADGYPCRVYHGVMIMGVVGRLRPGVRPAQLKDYLDRTVARLHPDNPRSDFYFSSIGIVSALAGELRPALLALLGAVGFVLLIACANVASLQLVHGAARTREMAVRTALGAERGMIMRQLLVENLVLSIGGGTLGLALGYAILKLLAVAGGAQMPALATVTLDRTVLAFTALATIASGLIFGLVPAVRSSRVDLQSGLKEGGRGQSVGAGKNRLLHAWVVLQVALTLVLLLGSSLMIRTMASLLAQDPGFRTSQVSTMQITATGPRYRAQGSLGRMFADVLERTSRAPGVISAGLVSSLPFTGGSNSSMFKMESVPDDPTGPARHADMQAVGGDYFQAMGIPLLRGRLFNGGDVSGSTPVVIVDERLVQQFFGSTDPIGKRILQDGPLATIVGVVASIAQVELGETAKATIYYPASQQNWHAGMYVVVRSAMPLATVTGLVRSAVANVDPTAPVFDSRLMEERVSATLAPRRLTMTVMSGLAVVSLLLAICGLYGVISYVVSQRSTEFGIRLALGAQTNQVRAMVVRQGLGLAVGGIAIGLIGAAAGTKALESLLYGISARDPMSFALAAVVLGLVAVGASYLPARRATRVSPVDALRRGE
jgi:putative ABC transport system permease protein